MTPTVIITHGHRPSSGDRIARANPGALVVNFATRVLLRAGARVKVSRQVLLFVVALAARPGAILSADELVDLLWADDIDGGPECADAALKVVQHHAVPAFAALGYRLDTQHGLGRSVRCCLSASPATAEAA